jgi:SAM-dependent methyltransferase
LLKSRFNIQIPKGCPLTTNGKVAIVGGELYGDSFYDWLEGSLMSARLVLGHLFNFYQPNSVLDVGCGKGTWLKACQELGATDLVGIDGPWNKQENLIDPRIAFKAVDLNARFSPDHRFDLAISLEVAEHLKPESASQFVDTLANASDIVLFGAAVKGQGGTGHINEQPQSYWGRLFTERNYAVVDIFRPLLWSNPHIHFHYRQNAFLYVKKENRLLDNLRSRGIPEMNGLGFMDCFHPELYDRYLSGERDFAHRAPILVKFAKLLPQWAYVSLRDFARRRIFKE